MPVQRTTPALPAATWSWKSTGTRLRPRPTLSANWKTFPRDRTRWSWSGQTAATHSVFCIPQSRDKLHCCPQRPLSPSTQWRLWTAWTKFLQESLHFQSELRSRQRVHPPPQKTVDRDHDCRHYHGRSEQNLEVAVVGCLADDCAQSDGRKDLAFQMKIFRNNAGVPRTAGCGHESGDQIRKDRRQDQFAPAFVPAQAADLADFFQVGGNRRSSGDHVEEYVPLCA